MGLGTIFSGFGEKAAELFSGFTDIVKSHVRVVIVIVAACMVIILLLLVLAIVSRPKAALPSQSDISDLSADSGPPDDFFLPYEPDFVPDVLLEREPRDGWTEEDAQPFWTDPMKENGDVWRKRIESGIDSMLEHIP